MGAQWSEEKKLIEIPGGLALFFSFLSGPNPHGPGEGVLPLRPCARTKRHTQTRGYLRASKGKKGSAQRTSTEKKREKSACSTSPCISYVAHAVVFCGDAVVLRQRHQGSCETARRIIQVYTAGLGFCGVEVGLSPCEGRRRTRRRSTWVDDARVRAVKRKKRKGQDNAGA